MFCGNCGNQLPDDARFCGECGSVIAPEVPAPAAAQTKPAPADPKEGGFFKKDVYFLKRAESKGRMLYFISWGLVFLCLLSVILSANAAINGDMLNRPVMNLINIVTEGEVTRFRSELSDDADEVEDLAEELDYDDEKLVKAFTDLARNFSLGNFSKTMGMYAEMYQEAGVHGSAAEARESKILADAIIAVIVVCFVIVGIVTALAALFKNFPLAIAAIVLDFGFVIVFSGFIWVLFALAVYVALIVVYIMMGKEYRAYAKSCLAA